MIPGRRSRIGSQSPTTLLATLQRATMSAVFAVPWFLLAAPAMADSLETADGETVAGVVESIEGGKLTIAVDPTPHKLRVIPMTDLAHIKFDPVMTRRNRGPSADRIAGLLPLVNNDHAGTGRSLSETIKLRAGFHRMTILYWHGDGRMMLRMQYQYRHGRKQMGLRIVPLRMLFHTKPDSTESLSPGKDKEGYRIAEVVKGEMSQLFYSIHQFSDGRRFASVGDMLVTDKIVASGTTDRVAPKPPSEESENFAMMLAGYIRAPEDGDYTFMLASDGGSQLFIGDTPSGLWHIDSSRPAAPWSFKLAGGGNLEGTLDSWTNTKIGIGIIAGMSRTALSVPIGRVAEAWMNKPPKRDKSTGNEEKIDRSPPSLNEDVVYARSAAGRVQHVPGRIQSVDKESVVLRFHDENRKIALAKVVGIVLATDRSTPEAGQPFHQIVNTYGRSRIPGTLVSFKGSVVEFRTLWGQELKFDITELTGLTVRNGKLVLLSELTPSRVEQVPYFDRLVPYRVNESLSGGPIVLRDGKCAHGISVHAKTVLHYDIGGRFQRFRSKVGFQFPEGALGDADVRVLGDDKILFEKQRLRGDGPVEAINLDVTGVRSLTLSVDFGRNLDIGDRVVWADPTLIRADVGSP